LTYGQEESQEVDQEEDDQAPPLSELGRTRGSTSFRPAVFQVARSNFSAEAQAPTGRGNEKEAFPATAEGFFYFVIGPLSLVTGHSC
jgi:hypothetical protein